MRHWFDLLLAADYFQLDDLKETVLVRQRDFLSDAAKCIQTSPDGQKALEKKRPEDFLTSESLDRFFEIVAFAYTHHLDTLEPYKKILFTFMRQIHHFALLDTRFKEHLRRVPQFGADLFSESFFDLPHRRPMGVLTSLSKPSKCVTCKEVLEVEGCYEVWFDEPLDSTGKYRYQPNADGSKTMLIRGQCMACAKKARRKVN